MGVRQKYDSETKEQARKMYREGLTAMEVGERLGIPLATVGQWTTGIRRIHNRLSYTKYHGTPGAHLTKEEEQRQRDICLNCTVPANKCSGKCFSLGGAEIYKFYMEE